MVYENRNTTYPNPMASAIRVPGMLQKYTPQHVRADATSTEREKCLHVHYSAQHTVEQT